ncbi:bacteriohemerythrin [Pseudomonas sp. F1_0610]|uniref:bacteriohemerythrin n=1 Tax=Pseudomonas sp. F1_0610 TaxID=3114284 RepID=UPI0039C2D809
MGFSIKWSDEFKTGIETIDEQHQKLFSYFEIVDRMMADRNAEDIPLIINGLIQYAISHNAYEELLMHEAGYPLLSSHRKEHREFKRRALGYEQKLKEGVDPLKIAREVRNDIGLWLVNHIKEEDLKYAPVVRKNLALTSETGVMKKIFSNIFG